MREISMFDHVKLKDGREGAVVEIFGNQDVFLVDIGTSSADWDTIEVQRSEIMD